MTKLIQPPPNKARPSTKVNDAPRQALVHRHVGLACDWIAWIEPGSVTSNPLLIAQRLHKRLAERKPTVFDCMMGVNREVALTAQLQIQNTVFGEQREHVIKERDAGTDGRFS